MQGEQEQRHVLPTLAQSRVNVGELAGLLRESRHALLSLTSFGDGGVGDEEEQDEEEVRIEAALNGGKAWKWDRDPEQE